MLTKMKFVELHAPLFHAGKNHGVKLDPAKYPGLTLNYSAEEEMLYVSWNDEIAWVPKTSVHSMNPGEPKTYKPQVTHSVVANIASAQVETPATHVQKGPGHGKTK
jgi:hypothetical protein